MTLPQIEIQLVAVVVAAACALPGVFLVLRRMAMMSDAISHAILPGIVVGFFLTGNLNSPLLIVAAAVTGLLTVVLVELLNQTKLVKEDAAIGIVFSVMFALGVILIARFAGDVHLDTDAVLLGELAFVPFDRVVLFNYDLGPRALWTVGAVLLVNILFLTIFYKELKLATFDAELAAALGFAPSLIHYGLMGLVSVTAVSAFDAVGSILVVALIIGPPASAYLLTDRLPYMMGLSVGIGGLSAVGGYWMAHLLDASIAGSMATVVGGCFGLAFLLAPRRGLLAITRRRYRQRWVFAEKMLVIHLLQHEDSAEHLQECHTDHLQEHFSWTSAFAKRVVDRALSKGRIEETNGQLLLTGSGRQLAQTTLTET